MQLECKCSFHIILRLQVSLMGDKHQEIRNKSRASAYINELVHIFDVHLLSADLSNEVHQP